MLDPYVRHNLEFNKEKNKYTHTFRVPDQHGIFHVIINYKKPGFSYLSIKEKIIVRPANHLELDRFLPDAFPYCASVLLSLFGFVIFTLALIFN